MRPPSTARFTHIWLVFAVIGVQGIFGIVLAGIALPERRDFCPDYPSVALSRSAHDGLPPSFDLHRTPAAASAFIGGHGPIFGEFTGDGVATSHFAEVAAVFLRSEPAS